MRFSVKNLDVFICFACFYWWNFAKWSIFLLNWQRNRKTFSFYFFQKVNKNVYRIEMVNKHQEFTVCPFSSRKSKQQKGNHKSLWKKICHGLGFSRFKNISFQIQVFLQWENWCSIFYLKTFQSFVIYLVFYWKFETKK